MLKLLVIRLCFLCSKVSISIFVCLSSGLALDKIRHLIIALGIGSTGRGRVTTGMWLLSRERARRSCGGTGRAICALTVLTLSPTSLSWLRWYAEACVTPNGVYRPDSCCLVCASFFYSSFSKQLNLRYDEPTLILG